MRPAALAAALALLALACTRQEQREREIRDEVAVVATREGPLAERAIQELKKFGRDAIPPIEAALPTASTTGRLNLVWALRVLGDPEAVPLLTQVALHDKDEAVRAEAETTLRKWATGKTVRAARATDALRQIEEKRGTGKSG
ncbi:MAG TPA: HEAT repeat domain-containing protein [Polyangia bacterium]|jgi:HEAT repeat protein